MIFNSYTAGDPMISHKAEGGASDGYTYSTSIGALTVGSTFDWGSQTSDTRKEYAIHAAVDPGEYLLSFTGWSWPFLIDFINLLKEKSSVPKNKEC